MLTSNALYMKKLFSIVLLIACCITLMAQEMPENLWQADVPAQGGCEYVANEVIVKFKSTSPVQIQRHQTTRRFVSASVSKVDMVLDSLGIMAIDDLMPLTGAQVSNQQMRVRGHQLKPDQNLSKLCNIIFDTAKIPTVDEAIIMLERLPEVEYAEPNYIVRIMATQSEDTVYNHDDLKTYTHEPLYSHQQHGIKAINLPWIWEQPKSKKRPVIAILDTGVDIEHPDLKDNIWKNEAEVNGVGGRDDDENGFFDDIHGYDFVNSTGVIGDRNGHGTHCAGIAAAVGNNGIGITGANPDALIMPIQVIDRTGVGNIATIIKGIDYASANGADILSMSIGGNCYSAAEEEALLKAFYNGLYLVGAAGNEGSDIYAIDEMCGRKHCFPGAFKFVLGVMATDNKGNKAGFSNFDEDGPYYSEYDPVGPAFFGDYYNYDIAAPGCNILSTFLGGTYTTMSGTSMSTPLVAGALSRLLQCRTFHSQESCQGLLIQTQDSTSFHNIDVKAAMQMDEFDINPVLVVSHYHIVDTIDGGNGDGYINPGETIEIYPTVKCVYGVAENTFVRINHGLNVDTTAFELLKRDASVGYTLTPGASIRCTEPIIAKVSEHCGDGYTIQLYPTIKIDASTSIKTASAYAHKLVLEVVEFSILRGILDSAMTLYPDKKYIIDGYFAMDETAELTIKPGVKILMSNGSGLALNRGKLIAQGTPDSLITFTMRYGHNQPIHYIKGDSAVGAIEYAVFEELASGEGAIFQNLVLKNCIIQNNYANFAPTHAYLFGNSALYNCNLIYNGTKGYANFMIHTRLYSCNIIHNTFSLSHYANGETPTAWSDYNTPYACNLFDNHNTEGLAMNAIILPHNHIRLFMEDPSYFGTHDEEEIRKGLWDVHHDYGIGEFIIDNRLAEPSRTAHGIVWKILINDEELEPYKLSSMPLGVGKHKFDIYFSRPMDVNATPSISFGVRPPYTQNMVEQEGSWSADSTVFTAYCTITARTMTDGENRILVTGAEDYDHFLIPDERYRFRCIISAVGSLNTGMYAEADMGKVTLKWFTDEEDLEDLMGYHIYRWTEEEDSTYIEYDEHGNWIDEWRYYTRRDTIIINDYLLTPSQTEFVDYNVVPGTPYYYQIQQVTTSLNEYDFSPPVAAIPLTAQKGDANGSLTIDVADIVTEVAYLLDKNPQPFIFDAADVNSDQMINILDIVGTVHLITNPAVSSLGFSDNQAATFSIEDGILYIETPVVLGGVQFAFNLNAEIAALEALNGFEQMTWNTAESLNFMAYSMSGKALGVGKHALLYVGDAEMKQIVLSNAQGQNVPAIKKTATDLSSVETMQMQVAHPNPFTSQVNIPYVVGQSGKHEVRLVFTNVAGLTVDAYATTNTFGEYTYTWHPTSLPEGVYFVILYVDGKKIQTSKLIRTK